MKRLILVGLLMFVGCETGLNSRLNTNPPLNTDCNFTKEDIMIFIESSNSTTVGSGLSSPLNLDSSFTNEDINGSEFNISNSFGSNSIKKKDNLLPIQLKVKN
jgi:hypothetical protein